MAQTAHPEAARVTDDVKALYERLAVDRRPYEDRARENAAITIPSLMPPEGMAPGEDLRKPYQSIGAHGVNTLTAKIVSVLLPPSSPMFRFSVSDEVVAKIGGGDKTMRSEVEKKLNEIERTTQEEIEAIGSRAAVTEAVKYLLVTGNVLLVFPKNGPLKTYRLDRYVVQRDAEGNVLKVIIKETVAYDALPQYVQNLLRAPSEDERGPNGEKKEYDLYTCYERRDGRIHTYQSIEGNILERTRGSWPYDKAPVMPLRWNYIHDEDYGRAYVSEYYGDLSGAENLSKAIREAAAAAARFNPMVNPTGLTRYQDVVNAENLDIIAGRKDDVTMLQFEKQADMQFVQVVLQDIMRRLEHAFMMNRSAQRQAERVTAEEIRAVIGDLDNILGGAYSLLAREFQHPFVIRMIDRLEREGTIPKTSHIKGPDGRPIAAPKVVTGVEALGRGQEYNKYRTFAVEIIAPLKEIAAQRLNIDDFLKRAATSLNIDPDGLLKTEEDLMADQQKLEERQGKMMAGQMAQDMVKGATPPLVKGALENVDPAMLQQMMGAMNG